LESRSRYGECQRGEVGKAQPHKDAKKWRVKRPHYRSWSAKPLLLQKPPLPSWGEIALALTACNAYNVCMQYTIRNVPDTLDEALRRVARERGKSLNEVAIEALARGAGVTGERVRHRDLTGIVGTWREDRAFDSAIAAQDTIDEEMWR